MATPQYWKTNVRPIVDGEPVNASITNRAIQDQTSREEYLYGRLQDISNGGRIVKIGAKIKDGVAANDIVYYNNAIDANWWEPAIANYTEVDGVPVSTPSSFAAGLVLSTNGTVANILLGGQILTTGVTGEYSINEAALAGMVDTYDSSFTNGPYYLSRKTAGKISTVASAPNVYLGYFSKGSIIFSPNVRSFQESHFHHAFDLDAKPSASQSRGTGAVYSQTVTLDSKVFVNYYFGTSTTAGAAPVIVATIKWTGGPSGVPANLGVATRIDLKFSTTGGIHLEATGVYGNTLAIGNPVSAGPSTYNYGSNIACPAYGQYVALGISGLSVAFFRADNTYTNPLSTDATALHEKFYKFYLPNDLDGWTNALIHPLEIGVPTGASYRYINEGQTNLNLAYPPLPLSSASLSMNGVELKANDDFVASYSGIWWKSYTSPPWPVDYAFGTGSSGNDAANARTLRFSFSKATTANVPAGVNSLQTNTPALVISSCPLGEPANDGALNIDLNLNFSLDDTITEGADLAVVGFDDQMLKRGPVVTELVAGTGITLNRIGNSLIPGTRKTGKVEISRLDSSLQGDISSFSLRNAKPIKTDFFQYIAFPPPAIPSAVTANFKVPKSGITPGSLRLQLFGQGLGSITTASDRVVVFKLVYHAVRPTIIAGSLSTANSFYTEYWRIVLPSGYAPLTVLTEIQGTLITTTNIASTSSSRGTPNLISNSIKDEDRIAVTISRVGSDGSTWVDNYQGDFGIVGVRWEIT